MANTIQFGTFSFDRANGVSVRVIREKSAAERAVALLQPARERGLDIISLVGKAKIIQVEGTISASTTQSTYTGTVRDFVTAVLQEDDLFISTADGLFVYESCICLNPESMLRDEEHYNTNFIRFTLEFLAPKGVAIANNLTQSESAFTGITSSPYTNQIQIQGTAHPDPIISLAIDSVGSGLSKVAFLNRDTNELLAVATNYVSGDVVLVDTKEKRVQYNARPKRFSGVFPRFRTGENRFRLTAEASSTIHASQTDFDSEYAVFSSVWAAQKIQPTADVSVSQIELLLKQFSDNKPVLIDDFQDNSIDTSEWITQGTVAEEDGRLRIGVSTETNSGDSYAQSTTASDEVLEIDWLHGDDRVGKLQFRNSNGSKIIEFDYTGGPNTYTITTTGYRGESLGATKHSPDFRVRVEQKGDDIHVIVDNTTVLKLLGQTMETLVVRGIAENGTTDKIRLDNFKAGFNFMANTDLVVEIQTDSGGLPSGTAVTNGSTKIKAWDIGKDQFTFLPAIFATAPSLINATDYHIVIKQTGGDKKNFFTLKKNTAGGYGNGSFETTSDSGVNWTSQADDLVFKLFSTFPTGWNIGLEIDYFKTHHSVA